MVAGGAVETEEAGEAVMVLELAAVEAVMDLELGVAEAVMDTAGAEGEAATAGADMAVAAGMVVEVATDGPVVEAGVTVRTGTIPSVSIKGYSRLSVFFFFFPLFMEKCKIRFC